MREQRIILVGVGNVGASLLSLLRDRADDLAHRHGLCVVVVGAVDSGGAAVAADGLALEELVALKHAGRSVAAHAHADAGRPGAAVPAVLAELGDQVDVLVQAVPGRLDGGGPGLALVLAARDLGLDVVLADKAPLVLAWDAVTSAGPGRVRYSGCVGGALPTVDLGRRVLASASAQRLETVLNGTCQLVLRLLEGGAHLDAAVAEAVRRGIAEPDPTLDLDGWDAAVKLVVLANAVLGHRAVLGDVAVEGIRDVKAATLLAARERGEVVVLLGLAEPDARAGWRLSVRPTALPAEHPLARMGAEEMGVVLHTDVAGRLSATSLEKDAVTTAAAVLRDLVDLASTTR